MSSKTSLPGMGAAHPEDGRPWWKYPVVWMVIGGPLSVIVACVVTWFFIMKAPDQVLSQTQSVENTELEKQLGKQYAPAQKARNHAATNAYKPADD